jgi:site-specific recombinase XerD
VAAIAQELRGRGIFDRGYLHKVVKKACQDAGVEPWNASWLRHSLATRAVNAGATVETVADFLGHRDRATTMRFYATHGVVPRPVGI